MLLRVICWWQGGGHHRDDALASTSPSTPWLGLRYPLRHQKPLVRYGVSASWASTFIQLAYPASNLAVFCGRVTIWTRMLALGGAAVARAPSVVLVLARQLATYARSGDIRRGLRAPLTEALPGGRGIEGIVSKSAVPGDHPADRDCLRPQGTLQHDGARRLLTGRLAAKYQ